MKEDESNSEVACIFSKKTVASIGLHSITLPALIDDTVTRSCGTSWHIPIQIVALTTHTIVQVGHGVPSVAVPFPMLAVPKLESRGRAVPALQHPLILALHNHEPIHFVSKELHHLGVRLLVADSFSRGDLSSQIATSSHTDIVATLTFHPMHCGCLHGDPQHRRGS